MAMAGGAIVGYCAMGSTQAKIGRSIKKRAMVFTRCSMKVGRCSRLRHGRRLPRYGLDRHTWGRALQPINDQLITGIQPTANQPLIPDSPVGFQITSLEFVVLAHHVSLWFACAVPRYSLLGNQQALILDTLFKDGADIHPRKIGGVGIGKDRA